MTDKLELLGKAMSAHINSLSDEQAETDNATTDKTCLSYWFPKIEAAGLPVPKTTILTMPDDAFMDIYNLFDGKPMTGVAQPFFDRLTAAADRMGYPCFLRTGHTSGKHEWGRTCFIASSDVVREHVIGIVYFSELAGIVGLPSKIWAVREFLPTIPHGRCPNYENMPLCREFRFFVRDGDVLCWHPYWPEEAMEQGGAVFDDPAYTHEEFCALDDETPLREIASEAGRTVGGEWSVDLLETTRGWYLIDMAESHKSFHWEGCPLTEAGRE